MSYAGKLVRVCQTVSADALISTATLISLWVLRSGIPDSVGIWASVSTRNEIRPVANIAFSQPAGRGPPSSQSLFKNVRRGPRVRPATINPGAPQGTRPGPAGVNRDGARGRGNRGGAARVK